MSYVTFLLFTPAISELKNAFGYSKLPFESKENMNNPNWLVEMAEGFLASRIFFFSPNQSVELHALPFLQCLLSRLLSLFAEFLWGADSWSWSKDPVDSSFYDP